MDLPKRKPTRLQNYNYSQNGYYFITICTHNRKNILSDIIVGEGFPLPQLTEDGKILENILLSVNEKYNCINIDKYVIMPNHIHAIIIIENPTAGASPCPTLSNIVCAFKSMTTRKCHLIKPNIKIWQTSFHDHIIRGEDDYLKIWNYIDTNPQKWEEDKFYIE